MFRLGKKNENETAEERKCRPIKIRFATNKTAKAVLKVAKKLKNLEDYEIYIKPDKTKGKQAEFKRMWKRKEEVLREYNEDTGRVKLIGGVLYVDNVEVDRYQSVQSLV